MVTMPADAGPLGPDGAPIRRSGRMSGYPGRADLLATQARLRGALTALARDPDPKARLEGVRLASMAVEALERLVKAAEQATTPAKRLKAAAERLDRKLDQARATRVNGTA